MFWSLILLQHYNTSVEAQKNTTKSVSAASQLCKDPNNI